MVTITLATLMLSLAPHQPFSLKDALRSARAHRPAYEAARLRVAEAEAARQAVGAFPGLRVLLGHSTDAAVGGSDEDLVLSQPLDLFGRSRAARAVGTGWLLQAKAGFAQVAVDIQSEVIAAYVEAVSSAQFARSASLIVKTLRDLRSATKERVESGAIPGIQLARVDLELEQADALSELRKGGIRANLSRLAAVIGVVEAPALDERFPDFAGADEGSAALLSRRPDLLFLQAEARKAEAELQSARLNALPELEFQARRTPWQETNERYGLRLQLSIPVFDYGRVRAETLAATRRAEAARKALADQLLIALGEVASSKIEVGVAKDQVARYEKLVVAARTLVERLQPGLTDQATTLTEVIDATRSLRLVEESVVEAELRLAHARARYLKACGHLLEVQP